MTNAQTARLMGDPAYRADAYADETDRIADELAAQQERVKVDQNWRTDWRQRVRSELVTAKPPTVDEYVRQLWDAETPIGVIAEQTKLTLGQIYKIVSAP